MHRLIIVCLIIVSVVAHDNIRRGPYSLCPYVRLEDVREAESPLKWPKETVASPEVLDLDIQSLQLWMSTYELVTRRDESPNLDTVKSDAVWMALEICNLFQVGGVHSNLDLDILLGAAERVVHAHAVARHEELVIMI